MSPDRNGFRILRSLAQTRQFHTTLRHYQAHTPTPTLSSRWLSDLKTKAKERSRSDVRSDRKDAAAQVLQRLERDWLELLAGCEGFLGAARWRGLDNYPVAWGEMVNRCHGHVNNVIYNKWAESSRVNWLGHMSQESQSENKKAWGDLLSPRSVGLIMKSIKTEYKMPIVFPDSVTVLHKFAKKPTLASTSLELEAIIVSHKHARLAARCYEDIVVYDYRKGSKTTLPLFMVEELGAYFDKQEETMRRVTKDILDMQQSLV